MTSPVELSFVIPVYNGSATVHTVVDRIRRAFAGRTIEIILVNDGSPDDSERVCAALVERYPGLVTFLHLARNFGEHSAVLAGLSHSHGRAVAVLDDDGQNPPEEVVRMHQALLDGNFDVVYGRYAEKKHHWFRNLGSRFNDRLATMMLKKPRDIYLSSFKVLNRFIVDEVTRYRGPHPYIDGLIFRTTRNIGQVEVEHQERIAGASNYTLKRLFRLWLNMFLGFSIAPLRLAIVLGLVTSFFSVLMLAFIVVDKVWLNPGVPVGIPTVLTSIALFAGVQLMVLGMVGEYIGRIFLEQNGMPQFVVRYLKRGVEANWMYDSSDSIPTFGGRPDER
jgi:undecaprenyl-phosphate 4-deoxy-4-formamido-L-arabinose transferase